MSSEPDARNILNHLSLLAAELGPMLAPAGHDELLQSIVSTAREMFGAGACSLALLDEDEDELVFHVASGSGKVVGVRVPVGQGIAGLVVASGQPVEIADVTQDPRFARDVAEQTGYVPRTILAMPLETEREMLGVIQILDPDPRHTAGDSTLLGLFARQAALALESERVFGGLGSALLTAAARATEPGDLASALGQLADSAPGPSAEFAQLAAHISELVRLGPAERDAATRLMGDLLEYARSRQP